jgi:hypothetical protein
MAARLGKDGNRQAMAHFVTTSPWDPAHVRARLAWMMEAAIRPTAAVFEDSPWAREVELRDPDGNRLRIGTPTA